MKSKEIYPIEFRLIDSSTPIYVRSLYKALEEAESEIDSLTIAYQQTTQNLEETQSEFLKYKKEDTKLTTELCAALDSIDMLKEYPIEFADWIAKYQYEKDNETGIWQYWDNGIGRYTTKELFELFKKEKHYGR